MNRWKDFAALIVFLTPMMFLPTMGLFVDFQRQSRDIRRSVHLFVAKNALRRLREKRRALVKRFCLFVSFDIGLFAFVGYVLCICIANESNPSDFFVGNMLLFSFLHLSAIFAYVVIYHDPLYGRRHTVDLCVCVVYLSCIGALLVTLISFVFMSVVMTLCF